MNSWLYLPDAGTARWLVLSGTAMRVLIAAFFVMLAVRNLSGDPQIAGDFRRFGYADGFRTLIALVQLCSAMLLLWQRTTWIGAAMLTAVMIGAAWCHLRHDPPATAITPLLFLGLTSALVWAYRPLILR